MFTLHYDTDLAALAARLADRLLQRDGANILVPQVVLVPQTGLATWLRQFLANRHGIAANLDFLQPAAFVWRLLRAADPTLPQQSRFDRETLRWRLFTAPELATEPDELRRYQLATRYAQLFEQYQGYRRDVLDAWQGGAEPGETQAELWRGLVATAGGEAPRNVLLGDYLRRCASPPPGLPQRVMAFACSNVSPDVLTLFKAIARHTDLQFFLPSPCREYWGDIESRREARRAGRDLFAMPDNPLLVSLGQTGREFVTELFADDSVQQEDDAEDKAPARDTLLHRVQADVIAALPPDATRRAAEVAADEATLRVHSCHSPLREVEVLHDRLLAFFAADPTLEPRDIAVLLPDVATYAPYIDAVFGTLPRDDPRFIPWGVSDRSGSATHAITALFLVLCNLSATRLTLTEALDVLAVAAVARRYGLTGADLDTLRTTAGTAGIVWGEDEHDRERHDLPPYREFSWAFGRERVLLGYLRGDGDGDGLVHAIAPIGDIEGDAARAFGALLQVESTLRELQAFQSQSHSARAWQERLGGLFNTLLDDTLDDAEQRAAESVRAVLARLASHLDAADRDAQLGWLTVRAFVTEALGEAAPRQRFLDGAVNVCGMVPLRNVPFRVVCVLGLGNEAYPRRDAADAVSRIDADAQAGKRRRGDRSRREDDRYLFLQTLMAGRDHVHFSYTGINQRNGATLEPSVLLSELLDVVSGGYFVDAKAAREALVVQHPMRPFSPRLFAADNAALFTYRHEWRAALAPGTAVAAFANGQWPAPEDASSVDIAQLSRWLNAPQRCFLRQRAGISILADDDPVAQREPLEDDPRSRLKRQHQMMQALLAATDTTPATLHAEFLARGLLPPLGLGDALFATTLQTMTPQARRWRELAGGPVQAPRALQLRLPSGRVLTGQVARYPAGWLDWVGNAHTPTGWMDWWLTALAWRAMEPDLPCHAFGIGDKGTTLPLRIDVPAGAAACAQLDALLEVFDAARRAPLMLPPRTGFAYAQAAVADKDALQAARKKWLDDEQAQWLEGRDDPWLVQALDGVDLFDDGAVQAEFERLAGIVYVPLWQAIAQGAVT